MRNSIGNQMEPDKLRTSERPDDCKLRLAMIRMSSIARQVRWWLKGSQKIDVNLPRDQIIIHGQKMAIYVNQCLFIHQCSIQFRSENETRPSNDQFELTLAPDMVTLIQSSLCVVFDVLRFTSLASHHVRLVSASKPPTPGMDHGTTIRHGVFGLSLNAFSNPDGWAPHYESCRTEQ